MRNVRTEFCLTVISRNLPCILSMISGARHKRASNLVYYSLLILCTFVVLVKTAKATCNIPFYCFIQHYLSRQEGISLLAVDHKPAEIFPSFSHYYYYYLLCFTTVVAGYRWATVKFCSFKFHFIPFFFSYSSS